MKRSILLLVVSCLYLSVLAQSNFGEVNIGNQDQFTLVTDSPIITDLGFSQACAWGDYDADGNLDLYVTNSWTNDDNLFYHNNGDGTFTKVTSGDIANDGGNSNGCTWGDYNNDGYLDLFVANVNDQNNFFYTNNGDATFTKNISSIISSDAGWSYGSAWGDYDNDGNIDLYVANYYDQKNFLYHNNGEGSFEKITSGAITNDMQSSQNAVWADLNNDGYIDLLVANYGLNGIYSNNKEGGFSKITNGLIATDNANSFGISVGDYNNDGLLDVFVANWSGVNSLYKNLGDFNFEKIVSGEMVTTSANTEGSAWGDYDNDGYLDLFITNDGINYLYRNNGDETFTSISNWNINVDGENSNGCALADYDNDGFLDLFIANGGNQTNLLYHNNPNTNNWLKIKLIGEEHNMSGIGARVSVLANINGQSRWQYREISAQSGGGYGSQNGLIANFGLANATIIESLIIKWNNNNIQYLQNIPVNSILTITEQENNSIDDRKTNDFNITVFPNPFLDEVNIEYELLRKANVDIKAFDINGKLVKCCIKNELRSKGKHKCTISADSFFDSDIYLLQICIDGNIYTTKLISTR